MPIQEIILPEDMALPAGAIFKVCGPVACEQFKVMRVRITAAGAVHHLAEVAGSLAVDPVVVHYDSLIERGHQPKVAEQKTCKKFRIHRATLHRRRARR